MRPCGGTALCAGSGRGTGDAIDNLGGITGAFLADIFFSLIGSAAYLVPFLLAYRAVSLLLSGVSGRGAGVLSR